MNPQTGVTYPETAWWPQAVPLWMTVAGILLLTLFLRGRLLVAFHAVLERRAVRQRMEPVDAALLWTPPIATPPQLLICCLGAVLLVLLLASRVAPMFVAFVLSGPLTALLIWGLLWGLEQRYRAAIDRALPAAVGRLGAQLRGGSGMQSALEKVLVDLPRGPLRSEWEFLIGHLGTPLASGTLATPMQVVAALAVQTPSARQAAFLGHLEVALGQPHDVLVRRVQAAYGALHAAEQRRSAAVTELAQMRYSGIAIGLASSGMAAYLFATQFERFRAAYAGPLGPIVGAVMAVAFAAPIAGGVLLSRVEDLDY